MRSHSKREKKLRQKKRMFISIFLAGAWIGFRKAASGVEALAEPGHHSRKIDLSKAGACERWLSDVCDEMGRLGGGAAMQHALFVENIKY